MGEVLECGVWLKGTGLRENFSGGETWTGMCVKGKEPVRRNERNGWDTDRGGRQRSLL